MAGGSAVQRYLCRSCGHRFSETTFNNLNKLQHVEKADRQNLNSPNALSSNCQGSREAQSRAPTSQPRLVQTLATVENPSKSGLAGATKQIAEIKGKIVEYCFQMQKQGYAESTIRLHRIALKILAERGADLLNPESVKEVIAKQNWSENRKRNVINAYDSFLKYAGLTWDKPYCRARTQKLPFIPTETELDALIAGSGKKLAAFLQLLKETAMRAGEAKRLKWTDIDFEKGIVLMSLKKAQIQGCGRLAKNWWRC